MWTWPYIQEALVRHFTSPDKKAAIRVLRKIPNFFEGWFTVDTLGRINKTMEPTPFAVKPLMVPSPRKERATRRGSSLRRYAHSRLAVDFSHVMRYNSV